jgi:BirA family biotin operon repressor/biotin-[acetyl-CoA-carboxylase] ligase
VKNHRGPVDWDSTGKFISEKTGVKLGAVIHAEPEMESTQTAAKSAARGGAPHGAVFVTDFQTAGKGRRDRTWNSNPGTDLTFSVILRPDIEMQHAPLLNLAASLSVCGLLKQFFRDRDGFLSIKWPNDVLAGGKKICGIICETSGSGEGLDYAVLGIGVNVNGTLPDMPKLDSPDRPEVTSIRIELGRELDLPRLLAGLLVELEKFSGMTTSEDGRSELIETYKKNCSTLGKKIKIFSDEGEFEGEAVGIESDGAITVTGTGGAVTFRAADVIHARTKR